MPWKRRLPPLLAEPTPVVCAGRTDAGVRATGRWSISIRWRSARTARGSAGQFPSARGEWRCAGRVRWTRPSMRDSAPAAAAIAICCSIAPSARGSGKEGQGWFHLPLDCAAMVRAVLPICWGARFFRLPGRRVSGQDAGQDPLAGECRSPAFGRMADIRFQKPAPSCTTWCSNLVGSLVFSAGRPDPEWIAPAVAARPTDAGPRRPRVPAGRVFSRPPSPRVSLAAIPESRRRRCPRRMTP